MPRGTVPDASPLSGKSSKPTNYWPTTSCRRPSRVRPLNVLRRNPSAESCLNP